MADYSRFKWKTNGRALKENIIIGEKYRFTFLTSRLVRFEYSESGKFYDEASQFAFFRNFPKTEFSVNKSGDKLVIETEFISLTYIENKPFSANTLSVTLKNNNCVWNYGDNTGNLLGTASTLDLTNGDVTLGDGVCSFSGFSYVDDSNSALLTDEGWFKPRVGGMDGYLFAYGHDYLSAVKDLYKLTGAPPMLPDYAFGNWWSRYHEYSQEEYITLMERFKSENIPLSVAVVDMDWHLEGWTGYTWNEDLFPDYKAFLKYLTANNLKSAISLHPADGVGSHECQYDEMADAMGVDKTSGKPVKFDCLNPKFMEAYFDILHHPYEDDGVDFWWMDWQQGTDYSWVHDEDHKPSELENITPLWLLNHLHILDIMRNGKRPMFFSRYAGLGSHRYPVGFSGDTCVTWESLNFQPYFTITASNAGYSWWSHDIGGHFMGYRDDELQVRWVQFGVFSPINRLHSCKDTFNGKEPWRLGKYECEIYSDYLRLRQKLFPYLYTINYRSNHDLLPLIQPLYYAYPEELKAYSYKNEYFFGSELLVAPITSKGSTVTRMGSTKMWIPFGRWFDVFSGTMYDGGEEMTVSRTLEQMPLFAKEGAIIPLQDDFTDNKLGNREDMTVYIFPGADNKFSLYEDEGDGKDYLQGVFSFTDMISEYSDNKMTFTLKSQRGETRFLPKKRNWTLKFRGFRGNTEVFVKAGKKEYTDIAVFDKKTNTYTVSLEQVSIRDDITVTLKNADNLVTDNANATDIIFEILDRSQASYSVKERLWNAYNDNVEFYDTSFKAFFAWAHESTHKDLIAAIKEINWLVDKRKK